jgi:hypothetical protein
MKLRKVTCKRCGYSWVPRVENPTVCANKKCKSPYWNRKRPKGVKRFCKQCGEFWISFVEKPKVCTNCTSPNWDKERTRKVLVDGAGKNRQVSQVV